LRYIIFAWFVTKRGDKVEVAGAVGRILAHL
jgi:hypothetical protein